MTIHGRTVTVGCPKAKQPVDALPLRTPSDVRHRKPFAVPWHRMANARIPRIERSVLTRTEAVFPGDFPEILLIDST